ncbi:hypothetical protein Osc1_17150 [Hominimerdicola sp. 21CYCFAH17_S]
MQYAIMAAVVGAFVGIVLYLAIKDIKKDSERVASMTEEQKQMLIETPDIPAEGLSNAIVTQGLIYEVKRKGSSKVSLVVMFYNRYYPNFRDEIKHADVSAKVEEFDAHGLQEGDYIKLLLNQGKPAKLIY